MTTTSICPGAEAAVEEHGTASEKAEKDKILQSRFFTALNCSAGRGRTKTTSLCTSTYIVSFHITFTGIPVKGVSSHYLLPVSQWQYQRRVLLLKQYPLHTIPCHGGVEHPVWLNGKKKKVTSEFFSGLNLVGRDYTQCYLNS